MSVIKLLLVVTVSYVVSETSEDPLNSDVDWSNQDDVLSHGVTDDYDAVDDLHGDPGNVAAGEDKEGEGEKVEEDNVIFTATNKAKNFLRARRKTDYNLGYGLWEDLGPSYPYYDTSEYKGQPV